MGKIEIEGMEFYAYHGHFKAEQIVGNKFIVDVCIETDMNRPAETDNLNDALDYQQVYKLVKHEMEDKSHLLEHIASRIIKAIKVEFKQIEKVTVKVSKINPPVGGKVNRISVTITD